MRVWSWVIFSFGFFLLHRLAGTLKYSLVLYWGWTVHQSNFAFRVLIGIHLVHMFPKYYINCEGFKMYEEGNQMNLALLEESISVSKLR